ncbi:MAG: glutaminyl-peptide cyclotransferase, partial [Deltaproteobacteria bacterium]|nr:glutaminyl-peptide cyclotransferase [Deltaproteobacteria bacterium]
VLALLAAIVALAVPHLVSAQTTAPVIPVTVEETVGRPQGLFTEGLVFFGQRLFESTGLYGQSALHAFPASELGLPGGLGTEARLSLPPEVFGEGLTQAGGELFLLTWREGRVFVADPGTLEIKRSYWQPIEGWGLAFDGRDLWRSDGTSLLQRHSVPDFSPVGQAVEVHDGPRPVDRLNELEWDPAQGLMLANIWHSDLVAAIDLGSGLVRYFLDLGPISAAERASIGGQDAGEAVANGLAIDARGRLWATGKFWPRIYRLSFRAPR